MHDAVELERHGRPTAVILTAAFRHEADVQLAALGATRLEPVVITHPVSTLSDAGIRSRAQDAASQITRIVTGSS